MKRLYQLPNQYSVGIGAMIALLYFEIRFLVALEGDRPNSSVNAWDSEL